MKADAVSMWKPQAAPGLPFLLRPGDSVYQHCFRTAVQWYLRAKCRQVRKSFLVGEADLREKDGTVRRQTPLFTGPCRLRA
jgi:hypothetical protein